MKIIPYARQSIDQDDIRAVGRILGSDWITQGPTVAQFEKALCQYTGARYAVAVSNGTAALHLACLAAGVKAGDEIITSPITFLASANCALYCGARPVFVDVERDTGNMDTRLIEKAITPRTKAIIPVHYAGHPCDLRSVRAVARKHGLRVIEDAAHALGAAYRNTKIGSGAYSDMTVFSFHPVKSITTGEGGAIMTNSRAIYQQLSQLRSHGVVKDEGSLLKKNVGQWYYEMQTLGFNHRITDIQCALGASQLKKLHRFIARRRHIVDMYNFAFEGNPYFDIPVEKPYAQGACHLYPIRLKEACVSRKKGIFGALRKAGLMVHVHYIPVYEHPYYLRLGYKQKLCPIAERFYASEISLPLYPDLSERDIQRVIKVVDSVFKKGITHAAES